MCMYVCVGVVRVPSPAVLLSCRGSFLTVVLSWRGGGGGRRAPTRRENKGAFDCFSFGLSSFSHLDLCAGRIVLCGSKVFRCLSMLWLLRRRAAKRESETQMCGRSQRTGASALAFTPYTRHLCLSFAGLSFHILPPSLSHKRPRRIHTRARIDRYPCCCLHCRTFFFLGRSHHAMVPKRALQRVCDYIE